MAARVAAWGLSTPALQHWHVDAVKGGSVHPIAYVLDRERLLLVESRWPRKSASWARMVGAEAGPGGSFRQARVAPEGRVESAAHAGTGHSRGGTAG